MKVVCDNCGAVYKIPEEKLTKEINKATCRKCGHRMLIRRQAPGAEAARSPTEGDEATVVGSAAMATREPEPAPPAEEPMPTEPRPAVIVAPPPVVLPPPSALPIAQAAPPPAPAPPSWAAPGPFTPAQPAAQAAYPPQPAAFQPAPPVVGGVPLKERTHDPAADLAIVLVGSVAAAAGAMVLSFAQGEHLFVSIASLLLALWGSLASVLVLFTGGWGRRQASRVLSVILGLVLAGVLTGAMSVGEILDRVRGAAEMALQAPPPAPEAPAVAATTPEAPAAPAPGGTLETFLPSGEDPMERLLQQVDAAAPAEPAAPEAAAAAPTPAPTPTPAAAPAPASSGSATLVTSSRSTTTDRATTTRTTEPSSASRTATSGAATPSRTTGSTGTTAASGSSTRTSTPAASSSSGSGGKVPSTVIDIQIRNNKNIKACFLAHKKTTGELPAVTLRFTLDPSGSVTSASIQEADLQGTTLESCLSGSVKLISFPTFEGEPYTVKYPFRF